MWVFLDIGIALTSTLSTAAAARHCKTALGKLTKTSGHELESIQLSLDPVRCPWNARNKQSTTNVLMHRLVKNIFSLDVSSG